ncbi:hypothetical protein DTL42_09040 [Bremerella cremea]|uniref:Uncharacterized protein n=1 Tax=Bremerella cremea TaxID=1031537 RepID=A0A368KVP1_9BACT|nr:hypothetical protein [Bremerella cremea]RCS52952.1 hypothetical protein DTL42_09040 [Bremerella cremea]
MARKVANRKELRAQVEAAEAAEAQDDGAPKKKKAKRKSRSKKTTEVRMKMFWGVFNQSMKRVALYEFDQKEEAEAKAADLSKAGKPQHFVQKVKETIEEVVE